MTTLFNMVPRLREAARTEENERGAALIAVIGVGAVLAMLMSMLVALSISGARQATSDEDWNAAINAAYAGVDEYQSRLAEDTAYYRYGNSASEFTKASKVSAPPAPNPAFAVGKGGGWADVQGSGGRAQYRYEVDNSSYFQNGRIRVRSTGKVGNATRTVVADLKQQGFIDFLYFSDYEVQDPSVAGTNASSCFSSDRTRLLYSWEKRPRGTLCNEISFGSSDTLGGPVHSNDTIRACSARFLDTVTTADTNAPYYSARDSSGNSCAAPRFDLAGYPANAGMIKMPPTNSQLRREVRSDLTESDVPRPGCLYTGPTQMTFNADGTVTIRSPFTKKTRVGNEAATVGSEPSECGDITQLQSANGATIPVPDSNVMFVQNVPTVSTDVNYWERRTDPAEFSCQRNGWVLGSGGSTTQYPMSGESAPDATSYGCRNGDVFVKGDFKGKATISAENYVYVVGNVRYVDSNEDILGLVGNNAVWVWNPVNSRGNTLLSDRNRRIDAALLSVAHTFQVQNYNRGSARGTLTVNGAIAQKYRGTVGTASSSGLATGYGKDYVYDTRYKFTAPPKFLNPVTTTYGVTTWVESAAVFAPNGAAK